ncbi:hypothetical protein IH770_03900, partial [Escherichia coli]|nr:hypothetical protein [Escherichia coli]
YGPVTFQMTYIPGTYNNGNVYFAWMRFQFCDHKTFIKNLLLA